MSRKSVRKENVKMNLFRSMAAGVVALGFVLLSLGLSSTARAESSSAESSSCAESVTSVPTGPATVSAETKAPFGKVLVVGSGVYDGCSLYLLTSDQLYALAGGATPYGCSDNCRLPRAWDHLSQFSPPAWDHPLASHGTTP
jgi:hypothetical protein